MTFLYKLLILFAIVMMGIWLILFIPVILTDMFKEWINTLQIWIDFKVVLDGINSFFRTHYILALVILAIYCVLCFLANDFMNSLTRGIFVSLLFYFLYPNKFVFVILLISSISTFVYAYHERNMSKAVSVILSAYLIYYIGWNVLCYFMMNDILTDDNRSFSIYFAIISGAIGISCLANLLPWKLMLKSFINEDFIIKHLKWFILGNAAVMVISLVITIWGSYKTGIFSDGKVLALYITIIITVVIFSILFIYSNCFMLSSYNDYDYKRRKKNRKSYNDYRY